jgi:uncharacterized protein YndB with AHSA1/START domain
MNKPKFVYVIYIATTREKLWQALTSPEWTRQYWATCWQDSTWEVGGPWNIVNGNGTVCDTGTVVEIDPPSKLVTTWKNQIHPELINMGPTTMTYELEETPLGAKLTLTHEAPEGGERFVEMVSAGWPAILSSLKSLLETGRILPTTDQWPE